ncbi:MAG: hypothetical protein ACI9WU_000480 [Myxococcota bacterium]
MEASAAPRPEDAAVSSARVRWVVLIVLCPLLAAAVPPEPGLSVALDLYAFSQSDQGGDLYRAEGFDYLASSVAIEAQLGDDLRLSAVGTVGYIDNEPSAELPESIENRALLTSASQEIITLDAAVSLRIAPPGRWWSITPGIYYHHQHGYVVFGADLGFGARLAGGDTQLTTHYSGRLVRPIEALWSGGFAERDLLITHNLLVSWTQTLSPEWLMVLSGQYTRQDGVLHSSLQYVATFDDSGVAVSLIDEVLPRERNRGQLNVRARYSPSPGWAVGLDLSGYLDDWDIEHAAIQPSLVVPLGPLSWRLWYQLAIQDGTSHFRERPSADDATRTADSDLRDFVMHSPGTTLTIGLGGTEPAWSLRLSGYGFIRDDQVRGGGGKAGVGASW